MVTIHRGIKTPNADTAGLAYPIEKSASGNHRETHFWTLGERLPAGISAEPVVVINY